jgi:alpha-L-fucosidase 2
MLLQSQNGEIHLLPALPSAWPAGAVRGLRARGGVEMDMTWSGGKLTGATLRSQRSATVRVRYAGRSIEVKLRGGKSVAVPSTDFGPTG